MKKAIKEFLKHAKTQGSMRSYNRQTQRYDDEDYYELDSEIVEDLMAHLELYLYLSEKEKK